MQVSNNQKNVLQQLAVALSAACVGMAFKEWQWRRHHEKYNDATIDRLHVIGGAYREITDVMEDVTMSGEEREKLIQEKAAFIEMICQMPVL